MYSPYMWGNRRFRLFSILLTILVCFLIVFFLKIKLGLDLQGGMRLVLQAKVLEHQKFDPESLDGSAAVVRSRIDALGVAEPVIQRKGNNQLIVELPGVSDLGRAVSLIGDSALLEFASGEYAPPEIKQMVTADIQALYGKDARLITEEIKDKQGQVVDRQNLIIREVFVTGKNLKYVGPSTDEHGRLAISIEFDAEGAVKMLEFTQINIGKPMIILLDGKVLSAPRVNSAIPGGKGIITGSFSTAETHDIIIKLKAGSLPVPLELVETRQIGPSLGKDSISKSLIAGVIGFCMVAAFMVVYYQFPGLLSIAALSIFMLINLAFLSLFQVTLTLTGIAGVLLSMGMAVDANVIIFERLKEELRFGSEIKEAIERAFDRAFTSIFDSNVTTIIGAAVLFFLGTGTIKGFALTLIIGILCSMFTAIILSHWLIEYFSDHEFMKNKKWIKK